MIHYAYYNAIGQIIYIDNVEDGLPAQFPGTAGVIAVGENITPDTHYFKLNPAARTFALMPRPKLADVVTVNGSQIELPPNCSVDIIGGKHIETSDKPTTLDLNLHANDPAVAVHIEHWPYQPVDLVVEAPGHHAQPVRTLNITLTEH